jgi:HAD superfamily hydrolase (TIGR01484 family)
MNKKKAFLICTDLDNTFLPISTQTLQNLISLIKDIKQKHDIEVKLCPITGRPPQFTCGVMHFLKGTFEQDGLENVVEVGAADQGGVFVYHAQPYKNRILARSNAKEWVAELDETMLKSSFGKYFEKDRDTWVIGVYMIHDKYMKIWSKEKVEDIIQQAKAFLEEKCKGQITVTPWKHFLEVAPLEVGKDNALREILAHYQKTFNVVGITYSGDAPNDLKAISYLTKFSEIPGIRSHVFLPQNAVECVRDLKIEEWKEPLEKFGARKVMHLSDKKYFDGVVELLAQKYEEGHLFGEGCTIEKAKDDLAVKKGSKTVHPSNKAEVLSV